MAPALSKVAQFVPVMMLDVYNAPAVLVLLKVCTDVRQLSGSIISPFTPFTVALAYLMPEVVLLVFNK